MNKIIAIDFDNTLFKTDWPDILEPIWGPSGYNHLCVRSAAAIMLDRLASRPCK